jgi:cobyrinic acid a,c-diamide synthase
MGGEAHCRALLAQAAREVDVILVEGVMGLFDGDPSSADLAQRFGLPVLAVIDGSAMAQTFAAVAYGLRQFRPQLAFAGVIANRVGSPAHADMLLGALPADIPALGWLPRQPEAVLPERHLGLLPAGEVRDIDARLECIARALHRDGLSLPALPAISFAHEESAPPPRSLAGRRIAIARDAAFAFIYPANLDVLDDLGAQCVFFSPVADAQLPECEAVWLPGGYPELHAPQLAANTSMGESLRAHHRAGKPILAECGGMMSLFDETELLDGTRWRGFSLLPGRVRMHSRFTALGMQAVSLPEGEVRGHSYHCSSCATTLQPLVVGTNPNGGPTLEPVYRAGRLTASYVHFYFPSNPAAIAAVLA